MTETMTRTDATTTLPTALFRHWLHSREEDAGGLETYRPEGFDLPPAHARDGFDIRADGTFIQEDVGPADQIIPRRGRWTRTGSRELTVRFRQADPNPTGIRFEIVELGSRILRIRRAATATVAVACDADLRAFQSAPAPSFTRLLDFDDAAVRTFESFPPQFLLLVRGTKPFANMQVRLVPLVYVQQPDFWEIEVVGSLSGIGLPAQAPYAVSLRLDGVVGKVGIEVVGASRRERFVLLDPSTSTES